MSSLHSDRACDLCKSSSLVELTSTNEKKCADCGHVQPWVLKPGQKPIFDGTAVDKDAPVIRLTVPSWVPSWARYYDIRETGESGSVVMRFYRVGECPVMGKSINRLVHELAREDVLEQIRGKQDWIKQPRYINPNKPDRDYIDETFDTYPWEQFVGAIRWTINKYFDRFGKKDDIEKEARKIADYANRFHEKVKQHVINTKV